MTQQRDMLADLRTMHSRMENLCPAGDYSAFRTRIDQFAGATPDIMMGHRTVMASGLALMKEAVKRHRRRVFNRPLVACTL